EAVLAKASVNSLINATAEVLKPITSARLAKLDQTLGHLKDPQGMLTVKQSVDTFSKIIDEAQQSKEAKEAQECQKVLSMVACIVVTVVAVVVNATETAGQVDPPDDAIKRAATGIDLAQKMVPSFNNFLPTIGIPASDADRLANSDLLNSASANADMAASLLSGDGKVATIASRAIELAGGSHSDTKKLAEQVAQSGLNEAETDRAYHSIGQQALGILNTIRPTVND